MNHSIKCRHCNGTGKVPLTGVYAETLSGVRRFSARPGNYVVAGRHWKMFAAPSAMALNNRLARLEQLGLVRSERFGRERRFYAK